MKYIDAEKLKAEIDNLESFSCISEEQDGFYSAISRINGIIDSLQQEQPEVDLEEEIDARWQNWLSPSNQKEVEGVLPKTEFAMYARHFYVLGRQEQPEVFDTIAFQKGVQEGRRLEREDAEHLRDATKKISEDLEDAK